MADTKTSAESAAATLDGTELIRGVQGGANVKITGDQVVNLAKLQKLSAFAATTSAELASVISNETGSGLLVFATSPTLTTPILGVAAATSINKVAITAPATSATLTIADGKTLTVSNTLTFTATDGSTVAFGAGGTLAYTSANLSVFAATTSAQLAGVISDETGSGALVFATSPTLVTPVLGVAVGTSLALGGATIGTDALGVTGTTTHNGALSIVSAALTLSGNQSMAAWTTAGVKLKGTAATLTDTSSSGTVAAAYTNVLGGNTIAASSATTFTDYYETFISAPVVGSNVTFTRSWSLGLSGALNSTFTSVASQAAALFSGTVFTGGSATTTKPHVLIEPTGTTSTGWSTTGTQLGVNAVSGFAGSLIDLQVAGTTEFSVTSGGAVLTRSDIRPITDGGGALGTSSRRWSNALLTSTAFLQWNGDTSLVRLNAANIRQGAAASATPVAQTFTLGEASRSGTDTNVGGASGTIQSGLGTGTGTASTLIFQTPALAASGTSAQTQTTRLTLGLSAVFGSAAIATNATDGFIYVATCAGTPTGVPTTNTGRVAMVYDTTNHQFWIYDGAWLQPKTPAAAAIVTWQ